MADKMMRIAGRSSEGIAKAIKTDEDGRIEISKSKISVPIKVPSKYMKPEIIDSPGYPLFVDKDGILYGENSGQVFKMDKEGLITNLVASRNIRSDLLRVEDMCITRSGKIVLSMSKGVLVGGEIWVGDSFDGDFTKVLEHTVDDEYADAVFRQSNFWYHNGFAYDIILAGTYGKDSTKKTGKLYISLDEGLTWQLIFEVPRIDDSRNAHVHSVAYDPYYSWIWVTYGDRASAGISYSVDLGATWITLSDTLQPSAVIPFQRNVAFGGDDPRHAAIYSWKRPYTSDRREDIPKDIVQNWHKLHAYNTSLISRKGVLVDSQHGAIVLASSTEVTGEIIAITGDGGDSWHPAFHNEKQTGGDGVTNAGPDGEFYYNIGNRKMAKFVMPPFFDSYKIEEV